MHVCYVLAEYPVASQTFVHAELVALRAAGIDVTVVAHRAGDPSVRFGEGRDGEPLEPLHVGLDRVGVRELLVGFDHLHAHFADFGVRVLGPLADAARRPWSLTAHAYDLFRADARVQPDEWRGLPAGCRKVVTISRFHRDFLVARGVGRDRVAVIPNAARLRGLTAPDAPRGLRRILAVGRPTAKKGFDVLLRAWALARATHPWLELEIIGGEGLASPPLPDGLSLTPTCPYDEVLDAMKAADLVVAPSVLTADGDMDGIPTVLVEAGALRRPVVSTELSGIGDLVVHGVNGLLVPPGNVEALAAALRRLADRPDEVFRLGTGGPVLAAAHDATVTARRLVREVFVS